jgi:hypothetical protein
MGMPRRTTRDYRAFLNVTWLCKECHIALHMEERETQ